MLARDVAERSRWHGRIAFLAASTADQEAVLERLRSATGVSLASPPTGLFDVGVSKIWHDFWSTTSLGPPRMTDSAAFLALIRELCDSVYDAVDTGSALLIDAVQGGEDALQVVASVYPDVPLLRTTADVDALLARPRVTSRSPMRLSRSQMTDRLIVIVGCGRSGTTWLESLLMAHPRCGGIEETESFVFHQVEPLWVNLRSDAGLHAYLDPADLATVIRRFCDGLFLAALTARAGADHFVEKTPLHIYNLEGMRAVYPDAWYVHLVRDGRDVVRSMMQVPFFMLPRAEDAAAVWRRAIDTVGAHADSLPRFREVRYEHLYTDPVGVVTDLLTWIGLDVDDGVKQSLSVAAGRRVSTHAGSSHPLGQLRGHGLTRRDLAVVHAVAGRALVALGYADRAEHRAARRHPAYVAVKARRVARRMVRIGHG